MVPIVKQTKAEQTALLKKFRDSEEVRTKENTLRLESLERVADLKDVSFSTLYREVGDNAIAKMAHVNSLARRLKDVEAIVNEFQSGPVKSRELEGAMRYVATPAEITPTEAFLVAKVSPAE